MLNIAILITCFNRAEKTESCLHKLQTVTEHYNALHSEEEQVQMHLFLTNDGCTDNTEEAVRTTWNNADTLHIIQGTGSLYWAGGMRAAWNEAKKHHKDWDFYFAVNDDADPLDNLWDELFATHRYAISTYGKGGVYMGCCRDPKDHNLVTYCGTRLVNKWRGLQQRIEPNGTPQLCDYLCANLMLIDKTVVDKIGIFYEGYQHGQADFDYAFTARKAGFPSLISGNVCGECSWGVRKSFKEKLDMVCNMTIAERKKYMSNPIQSRADYMKFVRRTQPLRSIPVWLGWKIQLYAPQVYRFLNKLR